jgi:hypothetical protein
LGNVDILGHAAPRRFDRIENSSELSLHALPNRQRQAQCQICPTPNDPKFSEALARSTLVASMMAWTAAAQAAECPRKDALGTSRVLARRCRHHPRVGLKSFPQTLPLDDHEVVLTFDDGPWPATTPKVLAALAHECVRATFFLIGKPASEHPGAGAEDRGRRATPSATTPGRIPISNT